MSSSTSSSSRGQTQAAPSTVNTRSNSDGYGRRSRRQRPSVLWATRRTRVARKRGAFRFLPHPRQPFGGRRCLVAMDTMAPHDVLTDEIEVIDLCADEVETSTEARAETLGRRPVRTIGLRLAAALLVPTLIAGVVAGH